MTWRAEKTFRASSRCSTNARGNNNHCQNPGNEKHYDLKEINLLRNASSST